MLAARTRPSARVAAFVLVTLVLGACSRFGGDDDTAVPDFADVTGLTATPFERWGDGFARTAYALTDERTVVVTGAGVFVVGDAGDEPEEIRTFDRPTQFDIRVVSPDRQVLAIFSNDAGTVEWYDLAAGEVMGSGTLDSTDPVRDIQFLGGSTTMVATTPTTIRTWDLASGATDATPVEGSPGSAAATADTVLIPLLQTNALVAFDGATSERREIAVADGATMLEMQTSPSLDVAAARVGVGPNEFDRTDTLVVLDAASLEPTGEIAFDRPLQPDDWAVNGSAIGAANEAELSVWSLDGAPLATAIALPDDRIQRLLPLGDGFVSVHQSGAVVRWAGPAWSPELLDTDALPVTHAATGAQVVTTVDLDGGISRWDVGTDERVDLGQFATGEATAVEFSADGERVGIATSAGRAFVLERDFDVDGIVQLDNTSGRIDTIGFNPVTRNVVTGLAERLGSLAFDDSVQIWDDDAEQPTATIGGESEDVAGCSFYYNRIEFTPDGELMTTVSHDFSISVHDAQTGAYVLTLEAFEATILDTAISVGGDVLMAAADDATVTVWDLEDYEEIANYRTVSGGLQAVEILPDDATAIATDLTGRLLTLDLITGEELSVVADLGTQTRTLAITQDGALVAAPTASGTVGIWSLSTGLQVGSIDGLTSGVTSLDFSPEGDLLMIAGRDGTVWSWQLDVTTA